MSAIAPAPPPSVLSPSWPRRPTMAFLGTALAALAAIVAWRLTDQAGLAVPSLLFLTIAAPSLALAKALPEPAMPGVLKGQAFFAAALAFAAIARTEPETLSTIFGLAALGGAAACAITLTRARAARRALRRVRAGHPRPWRRRGAPCALLRRSVARFYGRRLHAQPPDVVRRGAKTASRTDPRPHRPHRRLLEGRLFLAPRASHRCGDGGRRAAVAHGLSDRRRCLLRRSGAVRARRADAGFAGARGRARGRAQHRPLGRVRRRGRLARLPHRRRRRQPRHARHFRLGVCRAGLAARRQTLAHAGVAGPA